MGLQYTLNKENNVLFTDFDNAYWKVSDIRYTTTEIGFMLECYPSREASKMERVPMSSSTLPIGGANRMAYEPCLYQWMAQFHIADIFPNGIPLDENAQKIAIYNFIKEYTGLQWVDVFEE